MDYKTELRIAMEELSQDQKVRFIGYGVRIGGRALGTLKNVPDWQLIETTVAENNMVGLATGMSLKGLKPVVFLERFDFVLQATAAIKDLDQTCELSRGEFRPTAILRIVAGNRNKPLFTGESHTGDYTESLTKLVSFPVRTLTAPNQIKILYRSAHSLFGRRSTALVEYKDLM